MNLQYMNMQGMPPMGYPQPYPYPPYAMPYPHQGHYPPHHGGGRGGGNPKYSQPGPSHHNRPLHGHGHMLSGEFGRGDAPPMEHVDLKFGAFPAALSATDGPLEQDDADKKSKNSVHAEQASSSDAKPAWPASSTPDVASVAPAAASTAARATPASAAGPAAAQTRAAAPVQAMTFAAKVEAAAGSAPAPANAAGDERDNAVRRGRTMPPVALSTEISPSDSNEWARETQAPGSSKTLMGAPPGFGSPRGGNPPTPNNNGSSGGWKRGEAIQVDKMVQGADGVKRYDKTAILSLYTSKKVVPESIKELYLQLAKIERGPKGFKAPPRPKGQGGQVVDEPHPDEQLIFAQKDGPATTFRYQPSRLSDTTDPAVILMNANLILNKLSVTKFDKLSDEFMSAGLDSEELMGRAVEMVVKKAQVEEHFCFMYADLCRKITDEWSSGTTENEESLGRTFRVRLLEFCKEEFWRDRIKELEDIRQMSISQEEKDEREILLKKRYTGTMRFIGEIYMKNLVTSSVMQKCIEVLLESHEEETLVCMCKLFRTIGFKLENNDSKKKTHKVNDYFDTISKMAAEHSNSRIRFMLKDLVDMRKAGWAERRETEKAVKLGDLRDEAPPSGKGMSKSNSSSTFNSHSSKSQDARHREEKEKSPKVEIAVDEWQTIPDKKSKSKTSTSTIGASATQSKPSGFGAKSSAATANAFSALGKSSMGVTKSSSGKEKGKEIKATKPETKERAEKERPSTLPNLSEERTDSPALSDVGDELVPLERSESYGSIAMSTDTQDSPRYGSAGANGARVEKSVIEKVKELVAEYFQNGIDEDAETGIRELLHPEGMGDVMKPCMLMAFDKKPEDREKLVNLFFMLHTVGVLRAEQVARGLSAFLDDLDEISIDFPMAVRTSKAW